MKNDDDAHIYSPSCSAYAARRENSFDAVKGYSQKLNKRGLTEIS